MTRTQWLLIGVGTAAGLYLVVRSAPPPSSPGDAGAPVEAPAVAPEGMTLIPEAAAPERPIDHDVPPRTHSGKVTASLDPSLPPAYGPNPAKVHVVLYSDFQCPVCSRVTEATHQIPEEWPGDVRIEFRQNPLSIHSNAENAAVASLAAHRQGRFWEMHDVLFANQGALEEANLVLYAERAGLDVEKFRADYADPALRRRVRDEAALATRLEATATPGFFINGRMTLGWGSWSAFRGQVEQELKAVDALLAKGKKLAEIQAQRARAAAKNEAAFRAYKTGVMDPLAKAAAPPPPPSAPKRPVGAGKAPAPRS
jgi:protein-disulfide isomerase